LHRTNIDMPWFRSPSRIQSARLLGACLAVCGAPAAQARVVVPAVMSPASAEYHAGKIVFAGLVTPDLAKAEAFYGSLFGWKFTEIQGGDSPFAEATLNGVAVGALVQRPVPAGEHKQSAWLNFMSVPNVDDAANAVAQRGGRVFVPPHDLPERGREAILADPQGAVFGVLRSSSGDPPDRLKPPGTWIWHAVMARDAAADADFYKALFGYEVVPVPTPPGETHVLLVTEHYARASVNSLVEAPNAHPHWLGFVRVEDASRAAARVTALGGHVVVEPEMDRHGGLIAVATDPMGAPFGLFEWSETDTKVIAP
jgi:predicted enzyme related to lactoylglutathione lyase